MTEEQLNIALAAQRGMEYINLDGMEIPADVIQQVPSQVAKTYNIIPIEYDESANKLTVALDSPDNFRATDDLSTLMGFTVAAKVANPEALEVALNKYYEAEDESINELIGELSGDKMLVDFDGRDASVDLEELKELAESNPVKKLLNLVLLQAIRDKGIGYSF